MRDVLADLRFALRRWTKRPTVGITAILTLALGMARRLQSSRSSTPRS
jgi:hypothetical protein